MVKRTPLLLLVISFLAFSCEKEMTGEELLSKAINYHDPGNNWDSFNGELDITLLYADESVRESNIRINLPEEYFYARQTKGESVTEYDLNKGECKVMFNSKTEFSQEEMEEHRLHCEGAERTRNYYTFLYGLPMKLRDPGTHIDQKVEYKTVDGKEYVVLKATYDDEVGSDIWFVYFNPKTYAMEMYQFYKKDESGNMDPESGEYIMLSEEMVVQDIRMPKVRSWYFNKNNEFLGTDTLN